MLEVPLLEARMLFVEKLVRLNHALRALTDAGTVPALLERVLDVLQESLDGPRSAILLRERQAFARVATREAQEGWPEPQEALWSTVLQQGDVRCGTDEGGGRMLLPLGDLGLVLLERPERGFSEEEVALSSVLSGQTAWALRHLSTLAAAQERARRLELLHQSSLSLNSIRNPEALLDHILHLAEAALGFRSVSVLERNKQGTHLVVTRTLHPDPDAAQRIPVDLGIVGSVYRSGVAERIGDVRADPRYLPGGLPGGRSEMTVPLAINGETIGVLDAEAEGVNAFSEMDLEIFAIFGAQVATALLNARQCAKIERQAQVVRNITLASHALNTIKEPEPLMQEILRAAEAALGLDRVALLLPRSPKQELVVRSALGYEAAVGTVIPYGEGVTGRVAATGKPALVHDVASVPYYRPGVEGGVSEMAVPILVYGELLGVLDTESPDPEAFDEDELDLFQAFAEQVAVALHNSMIVRRLEEANMRLSANIVETTRLNRELEVYSQQIQTANLNLENQIRHLQTLYDASKTLTASLDLRETLDAILQMTRGIIRSSAGAIRLIDEETKEFRIKAEADFDHDSGVQWEPFDLPLCIGNETIGVFELLRDASHVMGPDELRMLEALATHAAIAIKNARLFDDTQRMYYDTLKSLARALEARDDYTRGHSERVAELSLSTSQMLGLPEPECSDIYNAALLHDIGKIGVRDEVLLKSLPLNAADYEIIRQHPTFGTTILGPLRFLGKAAEWVRHHHERWDGTGYPGHLAGEEIPLASRIIGVADAYDAMTSSRPYRVARTHEAAMAELLDKSGGQFDPTVVEAFQKVMAVGRS